MDGYNIIKQHPQWSKQPLEPARRQLIQYAASFKWPVALDGIKIVFDADKQEPSQYQVSSKITVCYVPDADIEIQQDIRSLYGRFRLALVSNDRELQHTGKSHQVRVYTVSWFLSQAAAGGGAVNPKSRREEIDDKASASAARRITEELSRYWLKNREK